jgi:hypothetical protein
MSALDCLQRRWRGAGLALAGLAAALALALASLALTAAPAYAGTYEVIPDCSGIAQLYATGGLGSSCDSSGGFELGYSNLPVPEGAAAYWQLNAPAGITITNVIMPSVYVYGVNNGTGWSGGDFYAGTGNAWSPFTTNVQIDPDSNYFGVNIVCGSNPCSNPVAAIASDVTVTATENQGPSLGAPGAGNLWNQASGRTGWIWNPAGDPWPLTLDASDPSGVCDTTASVNDQKVPGPSSSQQTDEWQQCPQGAWTTNVDTRDYVATAAAVPLSFTATNAAGVPSTAQETVYIDNDPVNVALSTPNDPNPTLWVNHAVTVDAAASVGPSGFTGMNCKIDNAAAHAYRAGGVSVNGNGVHTVACTASNNALDPQGQVGTGTSSVTLRIDEAPPSLSFEPQNPGNPTQLVVNTSDNESGVAGGSMTISGPGLPSPVSLPTTFDGSHLLASFDDAGLHGAYTFVATSCNNVGNCASTSEPLTLPVRLISTSDVSFAKIRTPAKIVRKRVLVGYHYKSRRRHGKRVRVKVGGHHKTIRIVIPVNTACAHRRVKVGRKAWREVNVCRVLKIKTTSTRRVAFGRKTNVHGLLISSQGAPIPNVPVSIETTPDNLSNRFSVVTTTTTSAAGEWSATLPAGPSRIVHAVYSGSATILPATGHATITVPAKIRIITITPNPAPWGSTITIRGDLAGGYLPSSGALVELHYGYHHQETVYDVKTHVTTQHFTTTFKFGPGQTPVAFAFRASTLPASGYAYAPGSSNTVDVDVGASSGSAPKHHHNDKKHKAKKKRKAKK